MKEEILSYRHIPILQYHKMSGIDIKVLHKVYKEDKLHGIDALVFVMQYYRNGLSANEIAVKTSLTWRHATHIINYLKQWDRDFGGLKI